MNYSQFENLPNEILLKIFKYINPTIKELLVFGHVSRRIRSVTHDQSLWQNVNLYRAGIFKNTVPAGLLQLVLENGCRRLYLTCSQIMGTLTLNQESQLEYLRTAGNTNTGVLTSLLASCHTLEHLHLTNVILNDSMISSICNQNGQTLKVLKIAHCKHQEQTYSCENCGKCFIDIRLWTNHKQICFTSSKNEIAKLKKLKLDIKKKKMNLVCTICGYKNAYKRNVKNHVIKKHINEKKKNLVCPTCGYESVHKRNFELHVINNHNSDATLKWIQPIIDNCTELRILDLSDTPLSEESIEYVAKNVTPTISKLWLYGIKSSVFCEKIVQILENRCNNLSKLRTGLRLDRGYEYHPIPQQMYYIGWQTDNPPIYVLQNVSNSFRYYE